MTKEWNKQGNGMSITFHDHVCYFGIYEWNEFFILCVNSRCILHDILIIINTLLFAHTFLSFNFFPILSSSSFLRFLCQISHLSKLLNKEVQYFIKCIFSSFHSCFWQILLKNTCHFFFKQSYF